MTRKIRLPWDERTTPSPVPEQVKIPSPWDEKVEPVLHVPPALGRGKKKPRRG
jgi:hypothetical protein